MLDPKANPNGSEHLVDKLRPTNLLTSVFRTPGVKNVEKAFSRGGTPPTRQAAVGTRTDSADQVGAKNVGTQADNSESFQTNISDQRPEGDFAQKAFRQALKGNPGGT